MATDWMWAYENPRRAATEIDLLMGALRNLVDALAENDEDGLTEFAPQMQTARSALLETER